MDWTFQQWQRTVVGMLAAATLTACHSDTGLGPAQGIAFPAVAAVPAAAVGAAAERGPGLTGCEQIQAPEGSQLAARLYASGVQIYRWSGTSWAFVAPSADLFADAGGAGRVGTHYAGPTWETVSGSKVVGSVAQRCTPDPTAVQWLLLNVVSNQGEGLFRGVTHVQRVNTVGGLAPAQPGTVIGQTANTPYTTEYLFYRAP